MSHDRACVNSGNAGGPQHSIESFRVKFQHRLREHLARHGSAAEAFKLAWDRTAREIALQEGMEAQLYWELVNWARSYDLFTGSEQPGQCARRSLPPREV